MEAYALRLCAPRPTLRRLCGGAVRSACTVGCGSEPAVCTFEFGAQAAAKKSAERRHSALGVGVGEDPHRRRVRKPSDRNLLASKSRSGEAIDKGGAQPNPYHLAGCFGEAHYCAWLVRQPLSRKELGDKPAMRRLSLEADQVMGQELSKLVELEALEKFLSAARRA